MFSTKLLPSLIGGSGMLVQSRIVFEEESGFFSVDKRDRACQ